jgi:hypothetical protein
VLVSRDRRVQITGQIVESCQVPRGQRFEGGIGYAGGQVLCLLPQLACALVVAKQELVKPKLALAARSERAQPLSTCQFQRAADCLLGVHEATIHFVSIGQVAPVLDLLFARLHPGIELRQALASSDRVGPERREEPRQARKRFERRRLERDVANRSPPGRRLAEHGDGLPEPVHGFQMCEPAGSLQHLEPPGARAIVRRRRAKGDHMERVLTWRRTDPVVDNSPHVEVIRA